MSFPMSEDDYIAVVKKPRTESVIEALRAEGAYDDSRSVIEYDAAHTAIPLTHPSPNVDVAHITTGTLPSRTRTLRSLLEKQGASDSTLKAIPSSWSVLGSIILVSFGEHEPQPAIGEALLDLHTEADTVLARRGITGEHRQPTVEVVAGTGETETIHTENGVKYALDLSKVMFSPGNKAERARMGQLVSPSEAVFDMFAGIGYFTLPMAMAGASVVSVERNPQAFRYLLENAKLNQLTEQIEPVLGDCSNVSTTADRVIMGYFDAQAYLDTALRAVRLGGYIHYHETVPESRFPDRPIDHLEKASDAHNRAIDIENTTIVKGYSPGVVHGVIDACVY